MVAVDSAVKCGDVSPERSREPWERPCRLIVALVQGVLADGVRACLDQKNRQSVL